MLTPVATQVLTNRYLQKDKQGKPLETIDQLWQRVAKHASKVEPTAELQQEWYKIIYHLLSTQTFLFNSPTLVNAGTEVNGLSACFVVGMEDSMDSIYNTKWKFAKIAQKGGGCGVNIDQLRPKNTPVRGSTHSKAGGPIAFLETIWRDMEAVSQAGFRSMACMAVCRIDHPDIKDFITCKSPVRALATMLNTQYKPCSIEDAQKIWDGIYKAVENGDLTEEQTKLVALSESYLSNFNISVGITDQFMEALKNGDTFDLVFNDVVYETVRASDLWNLIAENAHLCADPGLLFLDTANNNSPYRYSGQVLKSTNPCGEQPLPEHGVCNLGSIDVSKFIEKTNGGTWFNWERYQKTCQQTTHALNNICDIASWPIPEIEDWVKSNLPIGLGFMGFADACLSLGIRYGSEQSIVFAENITEQAYLAAEQESIKLGIERGIPKACSYLPVPRRNVTLLTVAPTGSISLIAGCSSGCEPVFEFVQIRQDNTGSYVIPHPSIKHALGIDDLVFSKGSDYEGLQSIARGILSDAQHILGDIFVSANDVPVEEHIKVQAAFQKYVDSAVSKTINMPNEATVEDIKQAYRLAYDLGCKGITVYRDGSKFFQILSRVKPKKVADVLADKLKDDLDKGKSVDLTEYTKAVGTPDKIAETIDSASPDIADAKRFKVTYKGDRWYVMVGEWDSKPMEVFTFTTKEDDTLSTMDGLTRMISLALKNGASVEKVIEQLQRVRYYHVGTFPAVIARVLSHYVNQESVSAPFGALCKECKSDKVVLVGGCETCLSCGLSKCG